uniref:SERTA domain-containing protein n=1 Tax=Cyclopterus lumpus TaxID=8103 RepID=A0A8C2XIY3_CYCLU
MLGRGVKRKWSCLQEPEAEEQPGGDGGARGFDAAARRLQQRQRVLGLCVEKLRGQRAGVELGLRRSVLLVNTLRQIQEDMRGDGGRQGEGEAATCPGCAQDGPPGAPRPPDQQKAPPSFGEAARYDLDVFEDIDTSMYDTADLWEDQDPKSCLDLNELDHIMEILVKPPTNQERPASPTTFY